MSETVKLVVEIETQERMGIVGTHKQVEDLVEDLRWGLGGQMQVSRGPPFEVTVWLRVRGGVSPEEYGRMLKSQLDSATWCLVEGVVSTEIVER